jgi:ABC-type sugar transport system substrate-binding protein
VLAFVLAAVGCAQPLHRLTPPPRPYTYTKSQTANWDATQGKAVTEARLMETKDVQGIFAQNDEMGLGAIEALKEAGLKPGTDVKILSVDATAGAFKAMIAGDLNVTVECNPLLAPQVYEAALKTLSGSSGFLCGKASSTLQTQQPSCRPARIKLKFYRVCLAASRESLDPERFVVGKAHR